MNRLIENMENFVEIEVTETQQYQWLTMIMNEQNLEAFDYYVSKGYLMNPRNEDLRTPMFYAQNSTPEFFEYIVQKGMDVHAVDIDGVNIMFSFCSARHEDVLKSVLRKGVNPSETNFDGKTFTDKYSSERFNRCCTEAFLEEHSIFYGEKNDFKESLLDKNYIKARNIIQSKIARMGGIEKLVSRHYKSTPYEILRNYHDTLVLTGDYVAATNLLKVIIRLNTRNGLKDVYNSPIGFAATLFSGDKNTARKISVFNIEHGHGIESDLTFVTSFAMLSEIEPKFSPIVNNMEIKGRELVERECMTTPILAPAFKDEPYDLKYISNIEEEMKSVHINGRAKYLFTTGMVAFYRKELVDAEYAFRKIIDICHNEDTITQNTYAQAHAMINYIHSLNN